MAVFYFEDSTNRYPVYDLVRRTSINKVRNKTLNGGNFMTYFKPHILLYYAIYNICILDYVNIFRSLASLYLDRCHRLAHVSFSFVSMFVFSFRRSLRFCHLEFYKEGISDGYWSENARYQWWVLNFKLFQRVFS